MKLAKKRSRISWLSTTVHCLWLTQDDVNQRNLEDLGQGHATKSPTVEHSVYILPYYRMVLQIVQYGILLVFMLLWYLMSATTVETESIISWLVYGMTKRRNGVDIVIVNKYHVNCTIWTSSGQKKNNVIIIIVMKERFKWCEADWFRGLWY